MEESRPEDKKIVKTGSNSLIRAGDAIQITNKLISQKVIRLFNRAFYLLHSRYVKEGLNYYELLINNSNFARDFSVWSSYPREAISLFTEIIKINPSFVYAYDYRGEAKTDLGNFERAIEDYSKAIEIDPNHASAYYHRSYAFKRLKKYRTALNDCTKAIKIEPNYFQAYDRRALLYFHLGNYQKSITDLTKAIELDPERHFHPNNMLYNRRGNAEKELGNYTAAIEDYTEAISLNPHYGEAYKNRAEVKKIIGDQEGAKIDFKKYEELKI